MAVNYRIWAEHGLVVIRYRDIAGFDETMERVAECAAEPDFDPTFKHIVDVRDLAGVEKEVVGFLTMQAKLADVYGASGTERRMVYLTNNDHGRWMAQAVRKSWSHDKLAIFFEAANFEDAFQFLGLPQLDLDAAFDTAS